MASTEINQKIFNNAIEKLIAEIPEGLSDFEKARYVYLEMGKLFSYDEKYMFGNSKIRHKMYVRAEKNPISFDEMKLNQKKKAICVSMTKVYNSTLNKIGIKACEYVPYDHYSSFFFIDGNRYTADLNNDLKFIQLHLPTKYFATLDGKIVDPILLEKIDEKLGYFYTGEEKIMNVINEAKEKNRNEKKLCNKVENIFNLSLKIDGIKDLGMIERNLTYDFLFKNILKGNEISKVRINKLPIYDKIEDKNKNQIRTNYNLVYCIQDYDEKLRRNVFSYFVYDNIEKRNKKMEIDDMVKFVENKYFGSDNQKLPGFNKDKTREI